MLADRPAVLAHLDEQAVVTPLRPPPADDDLQRRELFAQQPAQVCGLAQPARAEPALLNWIEVVSDVDAALRFLREQPRVASLRHDGNFVTFEGPSTPEERSDFAESLLHAGVHLSGFGTTATSAGGSAP